MTLRLASAKVEVDGIQVGGRNESVAVDHTHLGHKRKYERGKIRGRAEIAIAATSRESGLWNLRRVANERQPCSEHNVSEMVGDESHIRTDKGQGLASLGGIESKNFVGHNRVNHSGVFLPINCVV